jgi:DNA-directed RNA polymerase specialized sigma24 family protein
LVTTDSFRKAELKRDWAPTQDVFRQFLQWLDEGVDSGGERYVEMRRRLALYFDRKNCLAPDDLADETLSRVAEKLQEKGAITDVSPAHYCYIVAKFVFLESTRRPEHGQASYEELTGSGNRLPVLSANPREDATLEAREKLLEYLERCLNELTPSERELILEYHRGEGRTKIENRRKLAERLGLSQNALSIRACRIRNRVEACVGRGGAQT